MNEDANTLFNEFEEDFGFTTIDTNEVRSAEEIIAKLTELEARLDKVRTLVLPLLHNLQKDPDKDIHWPDRHLKLAEFETRFENALAGIADEIVPTVKKRRKKVSG